jgi:putative DNA primase/helicase
MTEARFDPLAAMQWLDTLYPGETPGLIHISATGNWAGRAFTDRQQAVEYMQAMDGREGVYLRATTLRDHPTGGGRGHAADSLALPGLWADLDIAGPGHKTAEPLPPGEDEARQIIATSGLPTPTLWVHSGGGLYPWWLLDQAAVIDDANRGELAQLSEDWQNVIGRAADALGWHYGTGVGDLARVLRIPGTVNRKTGLARPCRIVQDGPNEYTLQQLRDGLAAALERHPAPRRASPPAAAPGPPRLEVVRAPGEISPNDDFEARVGWDDPLLLASWTIVRGTPGSYCEWVRPGKDTEGISATTGKDPARDRMWCFSTDAALPAGQEMTKPYVYAHLHHGGDTRAATRELARLGYGTPLPSPADRDRAAFADLVVPGTAAARRLEVVDGTSARVLAEPAPKPQFYGATQDGMAQALVEHHGNELRYVPQRGKWLHWNGHQWEWDDGERHRELAKQVARLLPAEEKDWKDFRRSCLSAAGTTGITRQAQSDHRVVAAFDALDADPWALNTPNGIVDLRTGRLGPSNPDALCTRSTAVPYDDTADLSRWHEFLTDTFGGDQHLIDYLQRLVGYSAVGIVGPHVLPFAHGSGGNGKGVFLEALAGVLGDYATTAPNGFLMQQPFPGHETELARLAGARMVICSEVNEDDRFDEAKVKALTGGDSITARFMRQDHFTFRPTHQLWLMGNHQPAVRAGGRSFWRRLRLVPFEREVPDDKVVDDLQGILVRDHGPALLAWIAAGAAAYAAGGLREPEKVKVATAEYAHDQDSVARFVEECGRLGGGEHVTIKVAVVRDAYEAFCHAEGMKPYTARRLGVEMERRGILLIRSRSARLYGNFTLLADMDDEPQERAW